MGSAAFTGEMAAPAHSQTLSRGIKMLEILSDETAALSIGEVSDRLGVHRSVAYRILRTLEDHGLVARDSTGALQSILDDRQWSAISPQHSRRPEVASAREQGFAVSHHEVLPGVTGLPLR